MKYWLIRRGLVRYWLRTGDVVWWKSNHLREVRLAAVAFESRLGGPVEIYDRLKFRTVK